MYIRLRNIFLAVWSSLSKVDGQHRLHVPPLFRGQRELEHVIQRVVEDCAMRELGICSNDNSGHLVLGGVEGAGKTTLLRAFALATALLFDALLPVYWSYESTTPPDGGVDISPVSHDSFPRMCRTLPLPVVLVERILELAHRNSFLQDRQSDCKPASLQDAVRLLSKHQYRLFLLVDEFQLIYVKDELIDHRRFLARQMCEIARLPNTYCIIAGSSANMRRYLFRLHGDVGDEWKMFPSFNGSLYTFRDVPALRTLPLLKDYINTRYGRCSCFETDDDISRLLFYTGGVGRWIHEAWKRRRADFIPDRRAKPVEVFRTDADFRSLVALVVSRNRTAVEKHSGLDSLPVIGMEYNTVIAMAGHGICANIPERLRSWADQGLIYLEGDENGPKTVQLLVPRDCYLYVDGDQTVQELLSFAACLLMISGDDGVNAGRPLENLIRPRVHVHFPVQGVVCKGRSLRFLEAPGGTVLTCVSVDDSADEVVKDLDFLNLEHLRWKGETGLDGVLLIKSVDERRKFTEWQIHGWQCKGGRATLSIHGGVIETYEKYFRDDLSVKNIPDDMIGGILAKAEVGLLRLVHNLQLSFPHARFSCRSLTITTTKDGRLARAALSKRDDVFLLNRSLAKVERLQVSGLAKKQYVSVTLLDGLQWMSACVPDVLRNYVESADFLSLSPITLENPRN
jgi:hypothetical protein